MKREFLLIPSVIILLNVVSAATFRIGDVLNSFDSETVTLTALFLIFFAFLHFILSKFFKDKNGETNKAIVGVISLAISFLIIYGIYKTGMNVEDQIYGLGINSGLLSTLIPIILIVGAVFLFVKLGLRTLAIIGAFFIVVSLFGWVYEKEILFWFGAALIILFALLRIFIFKKKKPIAIRLSN